ncbi:MAG: type IV pilus assembly protein PilM [Candidatus Omnitrophica bacterium]|nr:type IV pilus assembly protein PilM [Candidatus Omnitrophota bacterium]
MAKPEVKPKFTKERFSVGLDIGSQSIKAVKLRFTKDAVEFCAFEIDSAQLDLASLLKKVKQSFGIDLVNISVSGPATVIRYVNFPKMNKDELKQALKFEAQKHIPFSISEINLDGVILKDDLPDGKMLVLLAAVKKDIVSQRLKLLEEASLRPNLIDIDSVALINAFNFNYDAEESLKNKVVALLNIGAATSNLNIVENGMPRLSRDIHIAGSNLTKKIMDTLGLEFNNAEELKLNPDKVQAIAKSPAQVQASSTSLPAKQPDKINAIVDSVLVSLAAEIRTSFDYYESQSTSAVSKIFISGGGSKMSGLREALSAFLGIEVEIWDPLKQMVLPQNLDAQKLKEISSQLPVAIGLALRA